MTDRRGLPKYWWDPTKTGLVYCMKCKKKTLTKKVDIVYTIVKGKRRDRVSGRCKICQCKKSMFVKAFDH